jgi:inosose dehydratase
LNDNTISRRQLLAGAATAALTAAGGKTLAQGVRVPHTTMWSPFRVGIQSYSLRGYSLDDALDKTHKLGLTYWEAFQAHIPLTDSAARMADLRAKLENEDIRLFGWGVEGFDGSEARARKVFEFAAKMKIKIITADPEPAAYPIIDKLLKEYRRHDIRVAIHNHGPGARYSTIASVANALRGRHERFGACVDTGHFLRSGEDPVEAVRTFGKRTFEVHIKDVKDKNQFTILGRGDLRTVDLLKELKRLHFDGLVALEYEEHPENPINEIDLCLSTLKDAVEKARNS